MIGIRNLCSAPALAKQCECDNLVADVLEYRLQIVEGPVEAFCKHVLFHGLV